MAKIATFDAVSAACEALVAAGDRASVRNVMAHIGGGSPNSVLELINHWKAQRPALEKQRQITLDEAIVNAIAAQLVRTDIDARRTAEEEKDSVAADMEVIRVESKGLEAANSGLQNKVFQLTEKNQQDAGVIQQLRADVEAIRNDSEAAIAKAREEAAAERARADKLTSELGAAAARLEALPRLEVEIARLREDLNREQDRSRSAESAAAAEKARADAIAAQIGRADASAAAAQSAAGIEKERAERLAKEVVTAQQNAAMEKQRADALAVQLAGTSTLSK